MGIKNDRWIREMAERHKMIEPFEPGLVAQSGAGRIVSYGTSSYGYDVRCANHFKIFTNVNSVIVDPKNFDENSFVDVTADVCIIPPNSFALAHTVEYFRIPRDVLVVCLGKSTYARCFRGDTRVALVDGSAPSLEEMARRAEQGEDFWGYSIGPRGQVMVTRLEAPRFIGRDSLLEITLDNGEKIHCTSDHEFMLRDGSMRQAHELRPATSLMPLYRQTARGYEMVYQPINGHLLPTHRLADNWNLRHGLYADAPGTHRHHLDHDRRNNRPWNIARMDATAHIRHHNLENFGEDFDSGEHAALIRDGLRRAASEPQWREDYRHIQQEKAHQFWNDEKYARQRAELLAQRQQVSESTRARLRQAMHSRYNDPAERQKQAELMRRAWASDNGQRHAQQAEIARRLRLREEISAESVRLALDETGSIRGAAQLLQCDRSVFRRFPEVLGAFRGKPSVSKRNHKITAIKELPGDHDVYCLSVPEAGNFALQAGVFVHNCGIVVNVTPLEPEWEGHVTLEFSNTTPLPAKIYAHEGVAQVLFFTADQVCETSYRDRGGKYQGQRGVTLPKT